MHVTCGDCCGEGIHMHVTCGDCCGEGRHSHMWRLLWGMGDTVTCGDCYGEWETQSHVETVVGGHQLACGQ